MSDDPTTIAQDRRALLSNAIQTIEQLQAQLEEAVRPQNEPIAVIGMGCRFPGAANPERFWDLLREGRNAVREVPGNRWSVDEYYDPDPDAPGKIYTRHGGFLNHLEQFDARFFGISLREAATLDPQQRLVLEVSWEALEDAGRAAGALRGSQTGVFVGIGSSDYGQMQMAGGSDAIDSYTGTGGGVCFAAGRVSYCLGLQGPSFSVDTACSSSLVAVHLACQSLRAGECRMAIAGGVNVMIRPEVFIYLCRVKALAADGRSKVFDAAADGFVRGEGCGMVVLKRLSDALADGDRICAVLRGSAINQDGPSGGLTVPNGPAQQAVIREALKRAGVASGDIDYVETHGTGTALGDPIETGALVAALGPGRTSAHPLTIASVKTNIGHLEAAAGVAGLIKVVLALQHGAIPPHLHFERLNPAISFESVPVVVPTMLQPWPAGIRRRLAGVSSFGLSGTNAHVIVEEAPASEPRADLPDRPLHVLAVSARSRGALKDLARRYADHLGDHEDLALADVCFSANTGRSHFAHRLAIVEGTADGMRDRLGDAWTADTPGVVHGSFEPSRRPKVAFLFTGQGAQYPAMGRQLYETSPAFRQTLDQVAEAFRGEMDRPLRDILFPAPGQESLIDETVYAQPALFAIEYAIAALWRRWGIEPAAVLGHSAGEYAAACVAGVLPLSAAAKLVAARGRLMQGLPRGGAMVAVPSDAATVEAAIARVGGGEVTLAAINAPTSVVISGAKAAVEAVLAQLVLDAEPHELLVSHASHSHLIEPMLDAFEAVAGTVDYSTSRITWVSSSTADVVRGQIDAGFWRRQTRSPVRFADAVTALQSRGIDQAIEVGPAPILLGLARQCGIEAPGWVSSLRKGRDEWAELLTSLGTLYVHGAAVDWAGVDRDYARRHVSLPTYPFERERCWSDPRRSPLAPAGRSATWIHPLLGREVCSPLLTDRVFETEIDALTHPFLADHRVFDGVVFPAAAYLEMVLAAVGHVYGDGTHALEEVVMGEAMRLPTAGSLTVQAVVSPSKDGVATFKVFSRRPTASAGWAEHASGRARVSVAGVDGGGLSRSTLDSARARCVRPVEIEAYYDRLRGLGIGFGQTFRNIVTLTRGEHEALGRISLVDVLHREAPSYHIHPALLDAGLQVLGGAGPTDADGDTYLPIGVESFVLRGPVPTDIWSHATIRPGEPSANTMTADITLFDNAGQVIAEVRGLQAARANRETLARAAGRSDEWLYHVEWRPAPSPESETVAPLGVSVEEVLASVTPQVPALATQAHLDQFTGLTEALDDIARTYLYDALRQLGWDPKPGDSVTMPMLAVGLAVAEGHLALFGRILEMLVEQGILGRGKGGSWVVNRSLPAVDSSETSTRVVARFATCEAEIGLIRRCGWALADVLRGRTDALQLLFPDGSFDDTARLYQDSPFARFYNGLVARIVSAVAERRPASRPLRILEVGAGTGGTTAAVLPGLPTDATRYVFTDVSPGFMANAARKFEAFPFVSYQVLDLERDPTAQGLERGGFDVVIAANVLHATRDLRQTMRHVQRVLAPGGLVVMLEATGRQDWIDLTFGLTPGWWRFSDRDLRPDHALLSSTRWLALLAELGFVSPSALPGESGLANEWPRQAVILAAAPVAHEGRGRWLICANAGGLGREVVRLLAAAGERPVLVTAGSDYAYDGGEARLDPGCPEHFQRLMEDAAGTEGSLGVVHLWSLDAPSPGEDRTCTLEDMQVLACESALHLVQASAKRSGEPVRVFLVTRGAQAVGDLVPLSVVQAPVWGLAKVVALEHPDLRCVCVDLDPLGHAEEARLLFRELQGETRDGEVALRAGRRHVARLAHGSGAVRSAAGPTKIREDASYLITGGLAGLGLLVAGWLAEQGARHLLLMARSEPSSEARAAIAALETRGVRVRALRGDVAVAEDVARALESASDFPPFRGVLHAAGVLDDGVVTRQNWARFAPVMRPKVSGAWNLHVLTRDLPLDLFVLFSSAAALLGSTGQSNHAAANAFLDVLAHHRRAMGRPGLSVNWGAWSEVGAAARSGVGERVASTGMGTISPAFGLGALDRLIRDDVTQAAVLPVLDWLRLLSDHPAGSEPPFLGDVARQAQAAVYARPRSAPRADLLSSVNAAPPPGRRGVVQAFVRDQVLKVLAVDSSQHVDPGQPLNGLGLDSLMAIELRNALGAGVQQTLPATLLFNYPTIDALTQYLCHRVLWLDGDDRRGPSTKDTDVVLETLAVDQMAAKLAEKLAALAAHGKDPADE